MATMLWEFVSLFESGIFDLGWFRVCLGWRGLALVHGLLRKGCYLLDYWIHPSVDFVDTVSFLIILLGSHFI